jgi:hypothetical protein
MKKIILSIFLFSYAVSFSQNGIKKFYSFDANYFYGTIVEHNPDLAHLITAHPTGVIFGFSQKTFGFKKWESGYNYPDLGLSFVYQDMGNPYLGKNFGLHAHLTMYFLNRNLMLRMGPGLAYASNPYHPDDNYFNKAYGSHILISPFIMANYKKENIFKGIGFQGGISLIHYSNADFKSPNNSTNTLAFNFGLNYLMNQEDLPNYIPKQPREKYTEPVHFNFSLRGGVNSMGIIGSGQAPFLTISAFADKVVSRKSTLQAGTELFFSKSLEERIYYQSVAFPFGETTGDEDSKRVGVFIGHQLNLNKLSLLTQLGYYVYFPYEHYVERLYNRIGFQYQISKNLWGSVTIRSHYANAEALEFSIGYRL